MKKTGSDFHAAASVVIAAPCCGIITPAMATGSTRLPPPSTRHCRHHLKSATWWSNTRCRGRTSPTANSNSTSIQMKASRNGIKTGDYLMNRPIQYLSPIHFQGETRQGISRANGKYISVVGMVYFVPSIPCLRWCRQTIHRKYLCRRRPSSNKFAKRTKSLQVTFLISHQEKTCLIRKSCGHEPRVKLVFVNPNTDRMSISRCLILESLSAFGLVNNFNTPSNNFFLNEKKKSFL